MAPPDTNPASGTRDFLPAEIAQRQRAFATIREVFERYGFAPLDTPAFERLDVLLGKYGDEGDRLIFKILRRGEHEETGEADLALRYDLTVPLARVVARYADAFPTPFKRYQIASVWRADRPGRGRFREFTQCDVDTVGSDSRVADAEVVLAVTDVLAALGVDGFDVQLNSRSALRGLIEAYGIPAAAEDQALVALDKLDKIGAEGVLAELRERGIPPDAVERIGAAVAADDVESEVRERLDASERGRAGLAEVDDLLALVAGSTAGGAVRFAPFLARGLSYYTGPIFEIQAGAAGGSIASGGRYDGLVGMFAGRDIPAVGGSIGVERVLSLLAASDGTRDAPLVLVTVFDDEAAGAAIGLATRLRREGIATDLWVGAGRLGKQLKYADRRGIRYALIQGESERAAATVAVKDLETGEQGPVAEAQLVEHLRGLAASGAG